MRVLGRWAGAMVLRRRGSGVVVISAIGGVVISGGGWRAVVVGLRRCLLEILGHGRGGFALIGGE